MALRFRLEKSDIISLAAAFRFPFTAIFRNSGMAMAATMVRIPTTIELSTRVNPFWALRIPFFLLGTMATR
jgi:hypothetical protein